MKRRHFLLLTAALPAVAQAQPAADLIAAARKEGRLSIYATTDAAEAAGLLDAFRATYPGIAVEYADQNSTELYNRFISEAAAGGGSADFLWSSAMDLQLKLVQDGHALEYRSTQTEALPAWANFRNLAYGTTAEPVGFVYNTRLVAEADVPRTHAALTRLATEKLDAYRGKLTSYDPERSGVGYLFITQDAKADEKGTWALARAIGRAQARLYTSSGAMLERIASGEHLIGFNLLASYAWERRKKDPSLGVVLPTDHTLVMSRVALIPKAARSPNAAKLFLDFLLSRPGQQALAERSMPPVRTDMQEVTQKLSGDLPAGALRPIPVGPELLDTLNATKRLRFLKEWQTALRNG
ncbi:ABC transporter substrate-binding protein [Rhodovastum atsumiense]|uniref:ABC transporter substrate-binding protein n=1 Tax=Rhodovastum atsumiense TaxID=504468 RepID=A0A5M6IZ75_9PROT|nr:ABC transporter substrate-binding protein [Rhodovastum atsumiense]KAA5613656.1 ABC transporter substrate-binding protein [Rhodovastum atsumiense]CAH2599566.1 ABC transporter substrate-binding protein [Rhodovastum atsumiense]